MRKTVTIGLMLTLLGAACSGDPASPGSPEGAAATVATEPGPTTTRPVEASTTTVTPSSNPAGLPASASVERLAWEGTVRVLSVAAGARSELEGLVEGWFVAPATHRVRVTATATGPEDGDVEALEWTATVVGATGWVLEDGELEAFDAETVVDEYMTVLSTASGTVLPSPAVLDALARIEDVTVESRRGRDAARFEISDASLGLYSPLFSSDFGAAFGTDGLVADVSLVVDLVTGAILEGRLAVRSEVPDLVFDAEISFDVTAVDDPSIVIAAPNLEVPDTLVPFEEERFAVSYPEGWNVDPFAGGVVFEPPFSDTDVFVSVVVDETAGSTERFIESLLSRAPQGLEVESRRAVESGGLEYERLELRFPGEPEEMRVVLWATSRGGVGYGLQLVARAGLFDGFAGMAEEVLGTFRPGP